MSTELLQAQLLLAAAHRITHLAREVRHDLSTEHHDQALLDLSAIRQELRGADRLLEELDAAIGALAHRECLTCDGEREPGRLQCAQCSAETSNLTPLVEAALRTRSTPTWPPRRTS